MKAKTSTEPVASKIPFQNPILQRYKKVTVRTLSAVQELPPYRDRDAGSMFLSLSKCKRFEILCSKLCGGLFNKSFGDFYKQKNSGNLM